MQKNYSYPLDLSWSTEELASVLSFNKVEEAYESKGSQKNTWKPTALLRGIVPSIGEEKRLGREFGEVSGYSLYRATQAAKTKEEGWFSLEE